jgi:hypothetical protein
MIGSPPTRWIILKGGAAILVLSAAGRSDIR